MSGRAATKQNYAATFAAVYALLLHAILSGAALGLPSFQVICSGIGAETLVVLDHRQGGVPEADHHKTSPCCLTGCPALGGPAELPAVVAYLNVKGASSVIWPDDAINRSSGHRLTAAAARAPPALG